MAKTKNQKKAEQEAKFEEFAKNIKSFSATQRASILDILHDNHQEESAEDIEDDSDEDIDENQEQNQ